MSRAIKYIGAYAALGLVLLAGMAQPDSAMASTGITDGLKPITIGDAKELQHLGGWNKEQVNQLAWSPDGAKLAIASLSTNDVLIRDVDGAFAATLHGHTAGIRGVAFSPDGSLIASASNDNTARVWQIGNKRQVCIAQHTGQVITVAFSPNGRILASSGDSREIILTDITTCATFRRWSVGTVVASLAFNHNGTLLASGGEGRTIQIWNPFTGVKVQELAGHTGWVWSLAFSPVYDNLLASAGTGDLLHFSSVENAARVWNVYSGRSIYVLPSGSYYMLSVAFSADGNVLATSSRYENNPQANNVRLWNTRTGQLIRSLDGTTDWSNVVAFNPAGTVLAVGSDGRSNNGGGVSLWGIPSARDAKP